MSWSDRLIKPVELPNGHSLVTLEDAAIYFQKLPKARRDDQIETGHSPAGSNMR